MDFPQQIYSNYLAEIKGIKFTPREIDVIACILCGRATTIASFLSISPRTVETHLRNIMAKLECNSRERIINFVESSNKHSHIRQYYQSLVILSSFEKKLVEFKVQTKNISKEDCDIYVSNCTANDNIVGFFLLKHFSLIKIDTKNIKGEINVFIEKLIATTHKIFSLIALTKNEYETNLSDINNLFSNQCYEVYSYEDIILILFRKNRKHSSNSEDEICFSRNSNNYYLIFLSIFLKIFSNQLLQKITTDFIEQHNSLKEEVSLPHEQEINAHVSETIILQSSTVDNNNFFFEKLLNKNIIFLCVGIAVFLGLFVGGYINLPYDKHPNQLLQNSPRLTNIIQESKDALLPRSDIFEKIERNFSKQQGIHTTILVGVGGSGKTTIARNFCLQQAAIFAWELNANNKESLWFSFKQLAESTAETPTKKAELIRIYQIQEPAIKEKQLLHFIQSELKNRENWLLIFDNVENLAAINNLVPRDPTTWGKGTVIITTTNSTIGHNSYFKPDDILQIQELTQEEACQLFVSILYGKEANALSVLQRQQVDIFLKQLPSFPLDISIAAYYIKNASLTLDQYIERIKKSSHNFDATQAKFLREVSEYNKTRWGIISSSLKNIIETDKRFIELLFLVTLLDSQQIPKNMLELFKEESIVDEFVYQLKKYSMILCGAIHQGNIEIPTLSIHRSTQKHGLLYCINHMQKNHMEDLIVNIVEAFEKIFKTADKKNPILLFLLPHLDMLSTNIEKLPISSIKIKELQKKLSLIMGYAHWELSSNLIKAKQYFQKAIDSDTPPLKPMVLSTLLKDMSRICWELCDFTEATIYSTRSLKIAAGIQNTELLQADNLVVMGASYMYSNNFSKAYESFNSALLKLSTIHSDEKKELEARIQAQIATLYATTFLHRSHVTETEKHVYESLNVINGNQVFMESTLDKQQIISCQVARNKLKLGDILCRLNKYQEALSQGFAEAEYIIKNSLDNCSHILLENRIILGKGESYLRLGNLPKALENLTKYINTSENLIGERNTWTFLSRVLRAEVLIRLGKLEEAFQDFRAVNTIDYKIDNNYFNLMYITSFYHAAVIKHLEEDPQNAARYFREFLTKINKYCRSFLEKSDYQDLCNKKVFDITPFTNTEAKKNMQLYFKNSYEIFVAIYGKNHSFIRDYVLTQYEKTLN